VGVGVGVGVGVCHYRRCSTKSADSTTPPRGRQNGKHYIIYKKKRDLRDEASSPVGLGHCNTLQHTATHYNTLQHTATPCSTLQHPAARCGTLQHTAAHCSTLQHTVTYCSTL